MPIEVVVLPEVLVSSSLFKSEEASVELSSEVGVVHWDGEVEGLEVLVTHLINKEIC